MEGTGGRLRRRDWAALVVVIALSATLAWMWASSLVGGSASVMAMGYAEVGGGPSLLHGHGATSTPVPTRSVETLIADPKRPADVSETLVARAQSVALPSGRVLQGYTLNGVTPGPTIRARQGQLVEVRVVNESVADGMTLHWHGVDVPNAEDGVAGVTQDAVARRARSTPTGSSPRMRDLLVPLAPGVPPAGAGRAAGGARGRSGAAPDPDPGRRRRRPGPHLRRPAHRQRAGRRCSGAPGAGRARPGPGDQHRQRTDARLGLRRPVPRARGRRPRREPAQADRRRLGAGDGRWPGGPRGRGAPRRHGPAGGARRVERPGPGRGPRHDACGDAASGGGVDLLTLRLPRAPGLGRGAADASVRLRDRAASGLRRRSARTLVDHQRPPLSRRPDVRGRPRATWCACGSATPAATCTRCTCTATTRWSCAGTGSPPRAARGGSTR